MNKKTIEQLEAEYNLFIVSSIQKNKRLKK